MAETIFFDNDGVRVTNTRFIVDNKVFVVSNITSVKATQENPNRLMPTLLILIGLALTIGGIYAGLLLCVIGILWWMMQKTVYYITVHTAGVEKDVIQTHQKEYVKKVIAALNKAIIHRG